jgi:hypothetical protein
LLTGLIKLDPTDAVRQVCVVKVASPVANFEIQVGDFIPSRDVEFRPPLPSCPVLYDVYILFTKEDLEIEI